MALPGVRTWFDGTVICVLGTVMTDDGTFTCVLGTFI